MKLYGFGRPTRATRAAWALEEVGADWTYIKTSPASPELLAVNPLGKVPTLVDGDIVMTESAAICTWIGRRHPSAGLVPPDGTAARAQHDRWCFFVLSELEQPLWLKAKHTFVLPPAIRVPDIRPAAAFEFAKAADVLEQELAGRPFLVGEDFTCADLLAAHTLSWARVAKFEVSDALKAYARPHLARPALARATARERGNGPG